jgi:hypothetical protein
VRLLIAPLLVAALLNTGEGAPPAEAATVNATAGIGGYVHPDRPVRITVEVASPALLVGAMVVELGGLSREVPVEVPGGGEKVYEVIMPPSDGGRLTVSLVADGGDQIVSQHVPLSVPEDELLVGLLGAPETAAVLGSVRSTPLGRPVAPIEVAPADLADPGPLGYLVAGAGDLEALDPGQLSGVVSWVRRGGRVIAEEGDLSVFEVEADSGVVLGPSTVQRSGRGELIAVESIGGLEAPTWAGLLRDVPTPGLGRDEFAQPASNLLPAAMATSEALVPDISWLLVAILGYALIVGPVNLMVLRRIGRRELAWVTVPVISVLAVAGFWLAGRSRVSEEVLRHASVVVADADTASGGSVVMLASGSEGERVMTLPDGWLGASLPEEVWFGPTGSLVQGEGDGHSMAFDFPRLGVAAIDSRWSGQVAMPAVELETGAGMLTVRVRNDTPMTFWSWGAGGPGWATPADGPLEPGQEAVIELAVGDVSGFGGNPLADAVLAVSGQDQNLWDRVYPLASSGTAFAPEVFTGFYLFGFTEDFAPEILVDERPITAAGPSLLLLPLFLDDAETAALGTALPEVIDVDDAGFVNRTDGVLFVEGGTLSLRYRVPQGVGGLQLDGGLEATDVWDWDRAEWVRPERGDNVGGPLLSPGGEVMTRLSRLSGPFLPYEHLLSWEAAEA